MLFRVCTKSVCLVLILTAVLAPPAYAASITFAAETFASGSGIGNVPTILVIQEASAETGGVTWSGLADVTSGSAKAPSKTWSVADLAAIGIVGGDLEFGLVFNLNESSNERDVSLGALAVNFFRADGSLLFAAPYTCVGCNYGLPLVLRESGQGTGSSGFLFRVALTAPERAQFFANTANRLGLAATINATDGGPETFYLSDLQTQFDASLDPMVPNPESASVVLLGTGLLGLSSIALRRRSKNATKNIRLDPGAGQR